MTVAGKCSLSHHRFVSECADVVGKDDGGVDAGLFFFFLESSKMCRSNKTTTYNPSSLSYTATTRDRNKAAQVRKGFKTNRRADGDAEQQVMELIPGENSRTHNAFNDAAR